jgi:hypothetical protein
VKIIEDTGPPLLLKLRIVPRPLVQVPVVVKFAFLGVYPSNEIADGLLKAFCVYKTNEVTFAIVAAGAVLIVTGN